MYVCMYVCMYKFKPSGLNLYDSSEEIMDKALFCTLSILLDKDSGRPN